MVISLNNPLFLDALLCAAVIAAGIAGYKRGLLKAVWTVLATAASIFLAAVIQRHLPIAVTGILSSVISFAVIRILFSVAYGVLELFFHLPVIKQTNGLAGAVIYIFGGIIIAYIILSFAAAGSGLVIEQTVICKYLHDYNIWDIIMGINSSISY